jgi:pimeloyl-ACP methyl ester carboxylesterase
MFVKPPLLLLCGLLSDETIWAEVAQRLADAADIRIVAFGGFSSIAGMAQHVLAVAPERFTMAGHSMGGRVALEVVRLAPERVSGVALLNTGVHARLANEQESRGRLARLAYEQGMSALALDWLPPMMGGSPAQTAELMPKLIQMVERSTPDDHAAQINALLHRPDAQPVLRTIKVPTLLLSGSNDTWSPLSQHEDMQRSVAHATLVEIKNAGHMAPIEQPGAVASALRDWLAAI